MKKELFEKLGQLHIATNQMEYLRGKLDRKTAKADKLAHEISLLENKYLGRYKVLPDFY